MALAQVVKDNVVINVIVIDDAVTISADGTTLVGITGGDIVAEEGTTFIMQEGAGVGWVFNASDGTFAPPANKKLTEKSIMQIPPELLKWQS